MNKIKLLELAVSKAERLDFDDVIDVVVEYSEATHQSFETTIDQIETFNPALASDLAASLEDIKE
jgi:hypothetical protein